MSYPKYMDDEQLRAFGFVVSPDDPREAYHKLHPNFSRRHRCSKCRIWASVVTGGEEHVCDRCRLGRQRAVNRQYSKLYVCCDRDECPTRQETLHLLCSHGIDAELQHDGFGEFFSLEDAKSISAGERCELQDKIAAHSMSKFGGRKLVHPGSRRRPT